MQKNKKIRRVFTLIFAAVLFFCFSMTAVFAEEMTTENPFFHFVNTPFKGVTVKLDTYDYDTYYSKITDEHKRLEAKTLQTQYSSRYQLNDFAVDEFTAVLKGGTDVNELKPISGADFKRYNNAGMYYTKNCCNIKVKVI